MQATRNKTRNCLYLVFKHSTQVITTSVNDFQQIANYKTKKKFFLPQEDSKMYYGFYNKIQAMEYAKSSALNYIRLLIAEGEMSVQILETFREDNYEDLNYNLLEAQIRKLETSMRNEN